MRLSRAVTHALTAVLPSAKATELLRACLSEDTGTGEWSDWRRRGHDLRTLLSEHEGLRALMPLLQHARSHAQAELDRRDLTVLRTASVREELRYRTLQSVAAEAIDALNRAGVEVLVTRGVALQETAYPAPGLRHSHDLDLLGRADELARGDAALARVGWSPRPAPPSRSLEGATVTLVHPTGFPLKLHTRLLPRSYYDLPSEGAFSRARGFSLGGVAARRPSSTDMLIHVCVGAVCRARSDAVKWVPDAWFTLRERQPIDWPLLTELAREGRLALPLATSLTYLARELDAPIPAAPLADLVSIAAGEDALALDGALALARSARRPSLPPAPDHLSALRLAARLALPSPAYMRAHSRASGSAELSLAYASRLLRAARRVSRLSSS
jgi:Uncharacterised nucleotidyltransferase